MLTFSKLGTHGRLGNQLFQIAALFGISEKNGIEWGLSKWEYVDTFPNIKPFIKSVPTDLEVVGEPHFNFRHYILDPNINYDLLGYFQSEKYFEHCKEGIKQLFQFHSSYAEKFKKTRPRISVSVRRGDYVDNPDYFQTGVEYQLQAVEKIKAVKEQDLEVWVFTDDYDWCMNKLPADWVYPRNTSITEQLFLISQSDHFVITNSTFSWFGTWLGEKEDSMVVAPIRWFDGELAKQHNEYTIVPERWLKFEPVRSEMEQTDQKKIAALDFTFLIYFQYDHKDRLENLELVLADINNHYDTNIIILETGNESKFWKRIKDLNLQHPNITFRFEKTDPAQPMHRTHWINEMARMVKTKYLFVYDTDVFFPRKEIIKMKHILQAGHVDMAYPYNGIFIRLDRARYYPQLLANPDSNILEGIAPADSEAGVESFGGAFAMSVEKFWEYGAENEFFVSFGPEDYERNERAKKLGLRIGRANGPLYHLNHWVGPDSTTENPAFKKNMEEYSRITKCSNETLKAYVRSFPWIAQLQKTEWVPTHSLVSMGFDKIYCVNLDKRPDRWDWAKQELPRLGLEIERFSAVDGSELPGHPEGFTPGMTGCYMSHFRIFREAVEKGWESFLVLEDDVCIPEVTNKYLAKALPKLPTDWEFVFLGYTEHEDTEAFGPAKEFNEYWVKPRSPWGTQAYMVRGRAAIASIYRLLILVKLQIDQQFIHEVFPKININWYGLKPCGLFQQNYKIGGNVQPWNDVGLKGISHQEKGISVQGKEVKTQIYNGLKDSTDFKENLIREIPSSAKISDPDWKRPYKLAAHHHEQNTALIAKHRTKIMAGMELPKKVLAEITKNEKEALRLMEKEVRPLWRKEKGIKAPEPFDHMADIPTDPLALVTARNNLRANISKARSGKHAVKWRMTLEQMEERMGEIVRRLEKLKTENLQKS